MIAKEVKRRTDKVHRDMSEVIVNEGPLSAVAMGVQAVNETLAHHAAWTEERFEIVEDRLGSLELGQQNIREDIAGLTGKVDGLSIRVGNLETAHVAMHAEMGRMEARLSSKIDGLAVRVDGIAVGIDKLAVRVDKVLAFGTKDELKLAEILKEGQDDKS